MKIFYILIALLLTACSESKPENETPTDKKEPVTVQAEDSVVVDDPVEQSKTYSNKRFKDVTVEKTNDHTFLITGKGQIFEANFGWVVEDGHYELKKGFEMTDAGAPEWGNFSFTIDVTKKRENSTLHLILFETSAMDGSRQHELPILLY